MAERAGVVRSLARWMRVAAGAWLTIAVALTGLAGVLALWPRSPLPQSQVWLVAAGGAVLVAPALFLLLAARAFRTDRIGSTGVSWAGGFRALKSYLILVALLLLAGVALQLLELFGLARFDQ
jgi:hypothetical protein